MTVTNNYNFTLQTAGQNVGTWGTTGSSGDGLNSSIFSPLDAILGANISVAMSAGSNSISVPQFQNKIFILTGNLTGDATLLIPLSPNSVGSATACGGEFIVLNNTINTGGPWTVTVKTAATGSTGVTVPQTVASTTPNQFFPTVLYSDTVNVRYGTFGLGGFALAVNGNPTGSVAGVAGSRTTNAQLAFDYTNGKFYICTTTGDSSTSVWTNPVQAAQSQPAPQGRLTLVTGTPVMTGDNTNQGTVYYTPYSGTWAAYNNGIKIVPFQFLEMQLILSAGIQTANNIYDVFIAYNGGSPVIGTGPAWSVSTAGTCSRGSGAGTTQIQRDTTSGLYVNSVSMSLSFNNGSSSGTISASPGALVYVGSISIDSTNGKVSAYQTYGQSRKYGVWNAFNRVPIVMRGGDNTASWTYAASVLWRQSNASSGNTIQSFIGLPEEAIEVYFNQAGQNCGRTAIGVGFNSTTAPSGFGPGLTSGVGFGNSLVQLISHFVLPPSVSGSGGLGVNNLNMIEFSNSTTTTFLGGENSMLMTVRYNG